MAGPQELYYKTTQRDGKDFWTQTIDYGRVCGTGEIIRHPSSKVLDPKDDATCLSISSTPGDSLGSGGDEPRLFVVRPVGEVAHFIANWYGTLALQVLEERPIAEAFGPNGVEFLEFAESVPKLSVDEVRSLAQVYKPLSDGIGVKIGAATKDTGVAAAALCSRRLVLAGSIKWAARGVRIDTAQPAALACVAVAWAIITRGLIPAEYTDLLMQTWRKTFGADCA
jgi:hypothetical protein